MSSEYYIIRSIKDEYTDEKVALVSEIFFVNTWLFNSLLYKYFTLPYLLGLFGIKDDRNFIVFI